MEVSNNLIYRKTNLKNIYKFSKVFDEVMEYEDYKKMILHNYKYSYKYSSLLKSLHLCFSYLINLDFKKFENIDLNILFNLLFGKNLKEENLIKILDKYEELKDEDKFLIYILDNLEFNLLIDKYAYNFVLMNYLIKIKNKTIYCLSNYFFEKYYEILKENKDKKEIIILLEKEINRGVTPSREYYENLKEITFQEIKDFLLKSKEIILDKFKITNVAIFGSFAKGTNRIDSDIDLLVDYSNSLSYEDKLNLTLAFKDYILKRFNRYGDVMENKKELIKDELYIKIY